MTSSPLLQLGSFQFTLQAGTPQTLDRTADYRWEAQDRILREPAYQFVGPGSQEITLDGILYPGFSGTQSTMETLRTLAASGEAQMLTDGLGRVLGRWGITRVREGQGTFAPGGAARRIDFSLTLVRYGEDNPGTAASPLSVNLGSNLPTFVTGLAGALGLEGAFTDLGSPFDAGAWAASAANAVTTTAAQGAGFSLGQLANIARSVGNGNYVGAALGAFGLAGLTVDQGNVWTQLGLNAAGMVQSMAQGKGAPSMAVALEALRPAAYQTLQDLAGSIGGANGLRNLVRDAATIVTSLDIDPHVTNGVRQLLYPVQVLTSPYPVPPSP